MKKLIAMILVLAICLGGCATGEPEMQNKETTVETTAATETTTEAHESTDELQTEEMATGELESTEELTTEAPMPEESETVIIGTDGPLIETKISKFLSSLPTDGTSVDYMEGVEGGLWEIGLGLELILYTYHVDAIREDVNYLKSDRERMLLAWEMASFDPNVEKTMHMGDNGYTAISEEVFAQYQRLLYGREYPLAMIPELYDIDAACGRFELKDGEVRCYYTTESGQFAPPMPENVQLTYEDGAYYLRGDVRLEREYYTDLGTYCGKVEIRLHKNDEGFYLHSLVLTDLIDEVKGDGEGSVPPAYADKSLDELIALVADGDPMSDEMKIAMQVCLSNYAEPVYWMLDYWRYQPTIDASVIDMEKNYLENFENRAQMAFFGAIDAESLWDVGAADNGMITGVTGGLAVTLKAIRASYKELFCEELDLEQMSDIEKLYISDQLVYGSYVTGWGYGPGFKDVSCDQSEENEKQMVISCIYLSESLAQNSTYSPADMLDYMWEAALCRLNFTFEKTQEGYRLVSLVALPL